MQLRQATKFQFLADKGFPGAFPSAIKLLWENQLIRETGFELELSFSVRHTVTAHEVEEKMHLFVLL